MNARSIVSLCITFGVTWILSYVVALGGAAIAISAFFDSDDIPTIEDVALFSLVGIAAFTFPASLVMTLGISTCAAETVEDVIHCWALSMILLACLAPAIGGAILDAPNIAALFNGAIVTVVILVAMLFIVPLCIGVCVRFWRSHIPSDPRRNESYSEFDYYAAYIETPSPIRVTGVESPMPRQSPTTPSIPCVVIDHPGGELHVGRPDESSGRL